MATPEEENKRLKEINNELAQKVQRLKMTAAQQENEKLNLMKEVNDLRLKLSMLRRTSNIQAQELDTALQSASEKALAHLVGASSEIARTMDIAKAYMRNRQDCEAVSPRWSSINCTPSKKDKVHRVPPLMMGGQSIQPVVSLSRAVLNTSQRTTASPNLNRSITARAVPMHMLQDVYIPLTRVDADLQSQDMEAEPETNNADDSSEDLGLNGNAEREMDDSERSQENGDASRILDVVEEDPEDEETTPPRNRSENPLEGPSWMLDSLTSDNQSRKSKSLNLEPDSTTELEENCRPSPIIVGHKRTVTIQNQLRPSLVCNEFTPTVRRRKRAASPPLASEISPRPTNRRNSTSNRVLKVLVAKMQLDSCVTSPPFVRGDVRFDAPSPNGATVPGVIVSEDTDGLPLDVSVKAERLTQMNVKNERVTQMNVNNEGVSQMNVNNERVSQMNVNERVSHDTTVKNERDSYDTAHRSNDTGLSRRCSSDSDSGGEREGRTRRTRKVVTYKEKPLNRKLRR